MNIALTVIGWLTWYVFIGIVVFCITWMCFVLLMRYKDETHSPKLYWLIIPGIIGWIGDIFFNIFYASPIFMMPPDFRKGMRLSDITLSHRLRQILRSDTDISPGTIRWYIADFICIYFIEPSDCTHCGRNLK